LQHLYPERTIRRRVTADKEIFLPDPCQIARLFFQQTCPAKRLPGPKMDQIAIFVQEWLWREQARVTQGGLAQARALLPLVPPFNPRDWTAG